MCGMFIQKGLWDPVCGKEGRKYYRAEGAIELPWSDACGSTEPGWLSVIVFIQLKGPCLHIPHDNLS